MKHFAHSLSQRKQSNNSDGILVRHVQLDARTGYIPACPSRQLPRAMEVQQATLWIYSARVWRSRYSRSQQQIQDNDSKQMNKTGYRRNDLSFDKLYNHRSTSPNRFQQPQTFAVYNFPTNSIRTLFSEKFFFWLTKTSTAVSAFHIYGCFSYFYKSTQFTSCRSSFFASVLKIRCQLKVPVTGEFLQHMFNIIF